MAWCGLHNELAILDVHHLATVPSLALGVILQKHPDAGAPGVLLYGLLHLRRLAGPTGPLPMVYAMARMSRYTQSRRFCNAAQAVLSH